jgi:hypothetical protein
MLDLSKFNRFNVEKIIQVLAYIQRQIKSDAKDKLKLIKLLFFADRYHLRKYLSFISFDIYYALRNGPAASKTLNVINRYDDFLDISPEITALLNKVEIQDKNNRIIHENETNYLSKVEMVVLDYICKTFGNFTTTTLIELTHDYPEWKRYEHLFTNGFGDSELIIIDDFFENPIIDNSPALKTYFNGIDPLYMEKETLLDIKEIYSENERIKNAYR